MELKFRAFASWNQQSGQMWHLCFWAIFLFYWAKYFWAKVFGQMSMGKFRLRNGRSIVKCVCICKGCKILTRSLIGKSWQNWIAQTDLAVLSSGGRKLLRNEIFMFRQFQLLSSSSSFRGRAVGSCFNFGKALRQSSFILVPANRCCLNASVPNIPNHP